MTFWLDKLERGHLNHVRKWHQNQINNGGGSKYSEQTLLGFVRDAKTIFGWACAHQFIDVNPMAAYSGSLLPEKTKEYVTMEVIRLLADAADEDSRWRVLFFLCRLGGLRLGTALELTWSGIREDRNGIERRVGVDFDQHLIKLVAKKTAMYREVPMHPELEALLIAHRPRRPSLEGALVVGLSQNNLYRSLRKIAAAAEVTMWVDPFQAMRASRRTDLESHFGKDSEIVNDWMGHSGKVGENHYGTTKRDEQRAMLRTEAAAKFRAIETDTQRTLRAVDGDGVVGQVA